MALPYVTEIEARKIAKQEVKNGGSQPQPSPSSSVNLYDLRSYTVQFQERSLEVVDLTAREFFNIVDSTYDCTKPSIIVLGEEENLLTLSCSVNKFIEDGMHAYVFNSSLYETELDDDDDSPVHFNLR